MDTLKLKELKKRRLKTVFLNSYSFKVSIKSTNFKNIFHNKKMNNNKEKIRMFLPFSWLICAAISFAYINSHLINT